MWVNFDAVIKDDDMIILARAAQSAGARAEEFEALTRGDLDTSRHQEWLRALREWESDLKAARQVADEALDRFKHLKR